MRISDELYFSPGITFTQLNIEGKLFPYQLQERFLAYYLAPAKELAAARHAFASGVLLVSCIDALALYETGHRDVGFRFRRWCGENLRSFEEKIICTRFYEHFRNGLVHEGRIKNGGEFSLDPKMTVIPDPIMSINPRYLAEEVAEGLDKFVGKLQEDEILRKAVNRRIASLFKFELEK